VSVHQKEVPDSKPSQVIQIFLMVFSNSKAVIMILSITLQNVDASDIASLFAKIKSKPEGASFVEHCTKILGPKVACLSGGDSFGEMSLMNDAPCSASIVALTPVEMVTISKEDYFKLPMLNQLVYRPGQCKDIFDKAPETRTVADVNKIMTFCKKMTLFSQIDETLLWRMCKVMKHIELPARCQVPLHSDESGSIMYVILSGSVSVHAGGKADFELINQDVLKPRKPSIPKNEKTQAPVSTHETRSNDKPLEGNPRPVSKSWWTPISTVSMMMKRQQQRGSLISTAGIPCARRLDVCDRAREMNSDKDIKSSSTRKPWNLLSLGACIHVLTPGDSFGEMSSLVKLRGSDGTAVVVTREPTSMVIIQHELYLEVTKIANFVESPELCREILKKDASARSEQNVDMLCRFLGNVSSDSVMFNRIPEALRKKMCKSFGYEIFDEGDTVIRQGDIGYKMFIVLTGAASVYTNPRLGDSRSPKRQTGHGKNKTGSIAEVSGSHIKDILESQFKKYGFSTSGSNKDGILMGIMHPGDVFGERSLLKGVPRGATVIARGKLELLTLDCADFDSKLLEDALRSARAQGNIHPGFDMESREMINATLQNASDEENRLIERVNKMDFIRKLSRFHSLGNSEKIDLAENIGCKKIEKDKVIFNALDLLSPSKSIPNEFFVIAEGKVGIFNNENMNTPYQTLSEGEPPRLHLSVSSSYFHFLCLLCIIDRRLYWRVCSVHGMWAHIHCQSGG
jgi:CRP-like cAMP-binding protein